MWKAHEQSQIRRLVLEVERYRRLIDDIELYRQSIDRAWKDEAGGTHGAIQVKTASKGGAGAA